MRAGVASRPRRAGRLLLAALLALRVAASPAGEAAPTTLDAERIRATAAELIALPARGMGRPGAAQAAGLIEERLRACGLEPLRVSTSVTVDVDAGSWLEVDGRRLPLVAHRPNHAAVSGTHGRTLTGPLLFAGSGSMPELSGRPLRGALVVLDGDSLDGWTRAAQLGAQAVIVSRPGAIDARQVHAQGSDVSIGFPRFIGDPDRAWEGRPATLSGDVRLEPASAWTVAARIPGSGGHEEAVLLVAGYEAPAVIGGLCPGATRAWNAALLLELARQLALAPPRRDVLVVFHGGRGEAMKGLRHLAAALCLDRSPDGYAPDGQLPRLAAEAALLLDRDQRVRDAFSGTDPAALLQPPAAPGDQAALALRERAAAFIAQQGGLHADRLQGPLERQRRAVAPHLRAALPAGEVAAALAAIDEADQRYQFYRTIQQKLEYGAALDDQERAAIPTLAAETAADLDRHLAVLRARRDDLASLLAARGLLAGAQPIHLIALDLGDGNERFAPALGGPLVTWGGELAWLANDLLRLADALNAEREPARSVAFDRAAFDLPGEVDAAWPQHYLHEAGMAGLYLPAATLSTTNDARLKAGSPQDTGEAFRAERFLRQTVGLLPFVRGWIDSEAIGGRAGKGVASRVGEIKVEAQSVGSKTGRRGHPHPFVTVAFPLPGRAGGEVRPYETWWGDRFGRVLVPFVPERHPALEGLAVLPYGLSASGAIEAVVADGGQLRASDTPRFRTRETPNALLPLLFRATPMHLHGIFDPRLLTTLGALTPLSATRDAAPDYSHVELADGSAAIFTEPGVPLRLVAGQGQIGNRMVLRGETAPRAGHPPGLPAGGPAMPTALAAAGDLWRLNEERLALLRRHGITSDSLVALHAAAERHLANAETAMARDDAATAHGEAQAAWAYAGRVYPSALATANDVVYGLVVMLLFAIPFAALCERLFLAGSTIARKVAGFAGCFVATFLFFYCFHPAFALATTPMIIFLAFTIIISSSWVIVLVYQRFEQEMEEIRMSGLGLHRADVSRLGTLFATVALGISNLRRRPLRTTLTASTVVLMTFILLTFASFNPGLGVQRIGLDQPPPYTGILVRHNGWAPLDERTGERLAGLAGRDFALHPLRWLAPSLRQARFPIDGPGGTSFVNGVVGTVANDPSGIERALVRGPLGGDAPRGFAGESDWLFLPAAIAERVGALPGERVRLRGVDLRLGLIDARALAGVTQLGGEALTPLALDPIDTGRNDEAARHAAGGAGGAAAAETTSFTHLGPSSVAVAHESVVRRLGGSLRAVSLVPRGPAVEVAAAAEEMAQQLAVTLRVGEGNEGWLLTAVGRLAVAGMGAVLVPLVLGGLIIFSTMLNSVAERGKEIFIYASLGLAPIHVAALFLVEAGIYAVLGGLGGYMLAHTVVALLGLAARAGWGVQPDLNYSSLAAVATILLVMAMVLLSALYPALVAARAANPGSPDFRIGDAEDDRLRVDFPFTVAARELRGLLAFLAHWLAQHSEASTGSFTAADIVREEGERQLLAARVWLAPFDLGLSQRFQLIAVPTDLRAINAVRLDLELLSGQRAAWKRANLAFLKQLRRQFLVWRSLDQPTRDRYHAAGDATAARLSGALA